MTVIIDELLLQRIARERRFDERTLEIARRLILGNESAKKLSTEFGVITQRIYQIRGLIKKAVEAYELPDGWTDVRLEGPPEVIQAVCAFYRLRMRALGLPATAT
jgi:hypothetical protein